MFLLISNYKKLGQQRTFYYRDFVDGVIPYFIFLHLVSQQVGNGEQEWNDWKEDLCFDG